MKAMRSAGNDGSSGTNAAPALEDGEQRDIGVDRAFEQQADAIAGPDAAVDESPGQVRRPLIELRVGQPLVAADEGERMGTDVAGAIEEVLEAGRPMRVAGGRRGRIDGDAGAAFFLARIESMHRCHGELAPCIRRSGGTCIMSPTELSINPAGTGKFRRIAKLGAGSVRIAGSGGRKFAKSACEGRERPIGYFLIRRDWHIGCAQPSQGC